MKNKRSSTPFSVTVSEFPTQSMNPSRLLSLSSTIGEI